MDCAIKIEENQLLFKYKCIKMTWTRTYKSYVTTGSGVTVMPGGPAVVVVVGGFITAYPDHHTMPSPAGPLHQVGPGPPDTH